MVDDVDYLSSCYLRIRQALSQLDTASQHMEMCSGNDISPDTVRDVMKKIDAATSLCFDALDKIEKRV